MWSKKSDASINVYSKHNECSKGLNLKLNIRRKLKIKWTKKVTQRHFQVKTNLCTSNFQPIHRFISKTLSTLLTTKTTFQRKHSKKAHFSNFENVVCPQPFLTFFVSVWKLSTFAGWKLLSFVAQDVFDKGMPTKRGGQCCGELFRNGPWSFWETFKSFMQFWTSFSCT